MSQCNDGYTRKQHFEAQLTKMSLATLKLSWKIALLMKMKMQWKMFTYRSIYEAATRSVYKKSCSLKCCNIHRKTPLLESLFNKGKITDSSTGVFPWILLYF